jgi:hypothetical protein
MKRIPLESEPTLWSPWTALGRAFRPRCATCGMQKQDAREISRPSAVHGDRGSRYTPLAALRRRVAAPSSGQSARKMRFHSRSVRSTYAAPPLKTRLPTKLDQTNLARDGGGGTEGGGGGSNGRWF